MKEETLKNIIDNILWMAVRYAHGRHTFAPNTVREVVKTMKLLYPDWKLRPDITIEPPDKKDIHGFSFRDDYLDDLF